MIVTDKTSDKNRYQLITGITRLQILEKSGKIRKAAGRSCKRILRNLEKSMDRILIFSRIFIIFIISNTWRKWKIAFLMAG